MSGAEAIGIVGLIASVITIIETSRDLYDAATNAKGLHEAFRAVSQNIPLVLNILRDCKRAQEQADEEYRTSTDAAHKRDLEASAEASKAIMLACEDNARRLKEIFEKVVPGDYATRIDRYKKAVQAIMPDKKRKVEDLMKDILEKLQLLHTSRFFGAINEERSDDLVAAIQQLSDLAPSLPDEDSRYSHSGSGAMNVNAGSGTQRNYSQSAFEQQCELTTDQIVDEVSASDSTAERFTKRI
ncbi:hypothetical protein LTR56_026643 [Elasticomyces elasticus]|nr:hypothetical protein LTR22_027724 [Elasticomyces elasticus]KAK3615345.1 hypothetical protein LTR56_026643 [Elasticomyces elasticus]KAK4901397.1 hypothetical protein LTR49_027302 [Elasticomyces elasticus]KAK5732352.1 hypothetical protein LTS12_027137 [Elasticomyces elasticus]